MTALIQALSDLNDLAQAFKRKVSRDTLAICSNNSMHQKQIHFIEKFEMFVITLLAFLNT